MLVVDYNTVKRFGDKLSLALQPTHALCNAHNNFLKLINLPVISINSNLDRKLLEVGGDNNGINRIY